MSAPQTNRESINEGIERRLLAGAWKEMLSHATLGYAHDLNNALTGILGLTETTLLAAKPDEGGYENLMQLKRSARQAAQQVEELAALHRAEFGSEQDFDMNSLVSQSVAFLRRALPRRVAIHLELSEKPLPVRLDAVQSQYAVAGSVFNASAALAERGTVLIRTSWENALPETAMLLKAPAKPPFALVSVRWAGSEDGMKRLKSLFEPGRFSQGIGWLDLGLLQARRLVEHCGGAVDITFEAVRGTTIHFFFPLTDLGTSESGVAAGAS